MGVRIPPGPLEKEMIEYTEIAADGTSRTVSMEELKKRARNKWFTWITAVGKIVGWSREEIAANVNDPNWFGCFDDGMSPEDAVTEARRKGIV